MSKKVFPSPEGLARCPFCGDEGQCVQSRRTQTYHVECSGWRRGCHGIVYMSGDTLEAAVAQWNRRVTAQRPYVRPVHGFQRGDRVCMSADAPCSNTTSRTGTVVGVGVGVGERNLIRVWRDGIKNPERWSADFWLPYVPTI